MRGTYLNKTMHTDKKENKIVLIYKEIQMGSGAKSYMKKEMQKSVIYEEVVIYDFAPNPAEFPNIFGRSVQHVSQNTYTA
jgi:hypothetical protein